jgi:hypothetical protein
MGPAPIITPRISVRSPHTEGRFCLEELSGEWLIPEVEEDKDGPRVKLIGAVAISHVEVRVELVL